MENIINNLINNFDFAYMLAINILTYIIIKTIDNFNIGKLSITQANIRYVYKGYAYQTEANDIAIPNTNNNYN